MDDATTAFATICAVVAASTGLVLCFAQKESNAVLEEPVIPYEEPKKEENVAPVNEEAEPIPAPEPPIVATPELVKEEEKGKEIPEQRPGAIPVTEMKKKSTKSTRWSRVVERSSKDQKGTWFWRPRKTTKGKAV